MIGSLTTAAANRRARSDDLDRRRGRDIVNRVPTELIVPPPGIGIVWDGISDGEVVDLAAWTAAGAPCQICRLPGGH